jgi:hypothetical protein
VDKGRNQQGWNEKSPVAALRQIRFAATQQGAAAPSGSTQENEMKIVLSIAAAAVVMATGATAGELPTFEVSGFPISPVQAQLIGAGNVREQSPAAPSPDGASASPHQISVLTPRVKRTAAAGAPGLTTTAGFVSR